jgi:hypothetical protein
MSSRWELLTECGFCLGTVAFIASIFTMDVVRTMNVLFDAATRITAVVH